MKTKGLGFMQLTIVVGFCLYYGYYLIAFFGAFAELPPGVDFTDAHLGQFVFFIGSIIGTEGTRSSSSSQAFCPVRSHP